MELTDIKGLGKVSLKKLNELGIYCVKDLSLYMPIFYHDFSQNDNVARAKVNQTVLFEGKLTKLKEKKIRYKNFFEASFETNNGTINAIWFNQPYIGKLLKTGETYKIYGIIGKDGRLSNPKTEIKGQETELVGIKAYYKLIDGISQNKMRGFISCALASNEVNYSDIVAEAAGYNLRQVLSTVHSPQSIMAGYEAIEIYKRLYLAKLVTSYKLCRNKNKNAKKYIYTKLSYNYVENNLPYRLTASQKSAINDIAGDFERGRVSRLLSGDVGSGKSIVAYIAAYINAQNGYQTVIVAPTEILAEQHYKNLLTLFERSKVNIVLLTSATSSKETLLQIKCGKIDIIVGTHAVFGDSAAYKSLTLAIIDEQHRFGVAERAVLELKNDCGVLLLTATPIPRTLMLTFLDGIDCSYIERRPSAKSSVETFVVSDRKIGEMWEYIYSIIQKGEQVFIVCPRITDEDGVCLFAAETLYDELVAGVYKNTNIALLHGRLKSAEKNLIMQNFRDCKINILIATTVIEVGIDIPNATVMVIMNADRYGLATLHQLRGRVGRGEKSGKCFLHTSCEDEKALDRLIALTKISDGAKLAEYDFEVRGAGDIFGKRQSGRCEQTVTLANLEYANGIALKILANTALKERFKNEVLPDFVAKVADITLN